MAEASGVWSELLRVDIPKKKEDDGDGVIDPARRAELAEVPLADRSHPYMPFNNETDAPPAVTKLRHR
jgi:hypothetical protein